MTRIILTALLLALSSCEEEKPPKPESPINLSLQRMKSQEEDLAKFRSDFKDAMESKFGTHGIAPEIVTADIYRIEGTHIFNYYFRITLTQEDQLGPIKKELHSLMLAHQVETIKFWTTPNHVHNRKSWNLFKDGTESRGGGNPNDQKKDTQRVLDRVLKRPK